MAGGGALHQRIQGVRAPAEFKAHAKNKKKRQQQQFEQ